MQLLINDKLYHRLINLMGKERADKFDSAIINSNLSAVENTKQALNISYTEAYDWVELVEDERDKEIIKLAKKIAKQDEFCWSDFDTKYSESTDKAMFYYFAEELGAIKFIEKEKPKTYTGNRYAILDKEKFVFLAKFIYCSNKEETLNKWKRKCKLPI